MVRGAAALDPGRLPFGQHGLQDLGRHLQRDVQIEVMLGLELERHVGRLKERQERAIVHSKERMQDFGLAATFGLVDRQSAAERKPEEVLVERPRFLRIATAIGVVVQAFDHVRPLRFSLTSHIGYSRAHPRRVRRRVTLRAARVSARKHHWNSL